MLPPAAAPAVPPAVLRAASLSVRLLLTGLLAGLLAVGLLLAGPVGSASAAFETPPTTQDDATTLDAGDLRTVDVVANDTDSSGGSDLTVCRYTLPDSSPLAVSIVSGQLRVTSPIQTAAGTYDVTYYACNYTYLTAGTLHVTIKAVPAVTGSKVPGRPGHVRFTNPGDQAVAVTYAAPSGNGRQGHLSLPAFRSVIVTVTKKTVVYVAVRKAGGIIGYGTITGIKPAKKHQRHTGRHGSGTHASRRV